MDLIDDLKVRSVVFPVLLDSLFGDDILIFIITRNNCFFLYFF